MQGVAKGQFSIFRGLLIISRQEIIIALNRVFKRINKSVHSSAVGAIGWIHGIVRPNVFSNTLNHVQTLGDQSAITIFQEWHLGATARALRLRVLVYKFAWLVG